MTTHLMYMFSQSSCLNARTSNAWKLHSNNNGPGYINPHNSHLINGIQKTMLVTSSKAKHYQSLSNAEDCKQKILSKMPLNSFEHITLGKWRVQE